MKLRLQAAILATALLLVAGAGSAAANVPATGTAPATTAPAGPAADPCTTAPGEPEQPPLSDDIRIPLEMVCPPPRPGPIYYASAGQGPVLDPAAVAQAPAPAPKVVPAGVIRVGRPQLGPELIPGLGQYRVRIPVTVELDVDPDLGVLDAWVEERGDKESPPPTHIFLTGKKTEVMVTSAAFYPPLTPIQLVLIGNRGSVIVNGSVRTIVATTADGGTIVLPRFSVSVDRQVPLP